jgi:hypothetical protein
LTGRVRFLAMQDSSVLYSVQTGSGAHPASYPMRGGGSSLGVKRQGREVDHSPSARAEVKNDGAIPPLAHVLMLNLLSKGIALHCSTSYNFVSEPKEVPQWCQLYRTLRGTRYEHPVTIAETLYQSLPMAFHC